MTGMGATSDQQRSRSRAHDGTARAFSKRSLIRRTRPTGRRADTAVPVRRCSAGMSQCQLLGRRRCSSWSATEARNQRKALQGRPSSNSCGGCLGAAAADEGGGDSSPALCVKSCAKSKKPPNPQIRGLKALRCRSSLERLPLPSCDGHEKPSFLQLGHPGRPLQLVIAQRGPESRSRHLVSGTGAAGVSSRQGGDMVSCGSLPLSGSVSAPDATSPLNCCRGGWWCYFFEASRQYLSPDLISVMIPRIILLKP